MMEVSLSFATTAANNNMHLLLPGIDIVALALVLTREITATFVLIGLYKSQTSAVVENVGQ